MTFLTGLTIQQLGKISPSSLVKFASALGLNHIEFDPSVFNDLENVKKVLKAKQIAFHSPYFEDYRLDLSSNDAKADMFVENVVRAKKELNVIGVVVHPPSDAGGSIDLFYERLEKLPFPLLENMPYQTWDEFKEFFDDAHANVSNRMGFCFDIPHSWITNGNQFLELPEFCTDLLMQPSGYIHISGGTNDEDTHYASLTEGDLPIEKVKTFLIDNQYEGTVTMELAPRSLEEIDKILHSYMIMLGIAGKRIHKTKVKIKRPFIMRNVQKMASKVDTSTFKKG
ncbi:MAG: sugar phosphate isomerase/epimerase family protein [Candidatus Hodarchaeales archaeon]